MKTFAIFATLLSVAFADECLMKCLNTRSEGWIDTHQKAIDSCNDKKDEKTTPEDPCDHEQQKQAAGKAHQHEACIFVAFGWVNATGAVQIDAMLGDFMTGDDAKDQALKDA